MDLFSTDSETNESLIIERQGGAYSLSWIDILVVI